jgi:pimeloyl-ACP methyl ester carboxylesterase
MRPPAAPARIPGVSASSRRFLELFYRELTSVSPEWAAQLALLLFRTPAPCQPRLTRVAPAARARYLPFAGGHLCLYEWAGTGPTILLVHGWSSSAARLVDFVRPLQRAGFSVIALDAPGHGGSSGLFSDVSRYRQALEHVLAAYASIRGVIAHSLGARTALLSFSGRTIPGVRALSLIAMPPDVSYMLEQFKLVLLLRSDVSELLQAEFERVFGGPPDSHSSTHAAVAVPTLLVHDLGDDVAPYEHAQNLLQQLPRASLLTTRGLHHCGALHDEATIEEVVAFMREHCARID